MNLTLKDGLVTINGKTYSGGNISINGDGDVVVDGSVASDKPLAGPITVSVTGHCESITTHGGDVVVYGNAGSVQTVSGDVDCHDVGGNIQTVSGDINCEDVAGSVKTVSGNVWRK